MINRQQPALADIASLHNGARGASSNLPANYCAPIDSATALSQIAKLLFLLQAALLCSLRRCRQHG
eukprot:6485664-Amphidinium_carterae.1